MSDSGQQEQTGTVREIADVALENVFILPASFAQQRLWFLGKLEPGSSAYNVPFAIRLCGRLNPALLEESLQEVVRRHEVLRTTFSEDEHGHPVQVVSEQREFAVPVVDLRTHSDGLLEEETRNLIIQHARTPFDLKRGPLFTARLFRLADNEHVLSLALHHSIVDGWSWSILLREMTAIYAARQQKRPSPLAQLPFQYGDYALWQQQQLQGERLEKLCAYWEKQLDGAPPVMDLPTDLPRPAVQSFRGGQESMVLPRELEQGLQKLGQSERVTTFMTLLAAFSVLLARYSGQEDIVVGTPISGRTRAEFEQLIGFFVNTLVLRANTSGNPTFRELLARVRETSLDAYAHQDLPFEKLVERLQPERDLSRNPIFQVMLIVENAGKEATTSIPGLTISPFHGAEGMTAKFDLLLTAVIKPEASRLVLTYNLDLFRASTVARMLGHLRTLLEQIVTDPDRRIGDLPMLSAAEREQLLFGLNNTAKEYPSGICVHELFQQQAQQSPNSTAAVCGEDSLTYAQLNRSANQLARHLQSHGVRAGSLVGICMERSLQMVTSVLAVLKAGAAYVPLDPEYPRDRLAFMLQDSGAAVVLTQEALRNLLPPTANVIAVDSAWPEITAESGENPLVQVTAEAPVYTIYTSGSTGRPKGVCLPQRALTNLLLWQQENSAAGDHSRTLQFTSLSFDVSFQEIFSTWCTGGLLVLISESTRRDPAALLRFLREQKIERIFLPFVGLQQLAEAAEERSDVPHTLCEVITAGEQLRITKQVASFFSALPACTLVNQYGPSETHVVTSYRLRGNPEQWDALPPIGKPISNAEAYILDATGNPVPLGATGELYVGGAPLAIGYLNRPELTQARFVSQRFGDANERTLYRTGDLCRYLSDGNIQYLGRADNQVKIRGYRIELGEIESVLHRHPGVQHALVVVREDIPSDKRLVAYVVPAPGQDPSASELRTHIKQSLPDYMVPGAFVKLDALPLTPSGKTNRRALPTPDSTEAQSETAGLITVTQELLLSIWMEVLRRTGFGVHDNFFDLGGHSLLATRVASEIAKAFGLDLPLRSIFEHPTIAELATIIDEGRKSSRRSPLPSPIRQPQKVQPSPQGELVAVSPLSFAEQRLWILDRLEPNTSAYNLSVSLRLKGDLHHEALRQSIEEITRRHEILRARFRLKGEEPERCVYDRMGFDLSMVDLTEAENPELQARLLARQVARKPFDLEKDAMLRGTLIKLADSDHVLLLTVHHIVFDGWSRGVLLDEISALYESFLRGQPAALPELALQYSDFAIWQQQCLTGEVLEEQLSFWKRHLQDAPPALELPTDRPRPTMQTFHGSQSSMLIPAPLVDKLKALSRKSGATLFMTLLAALNVLLGRYSGQDDIVVGCPVAGRNRPEFDKLIGFFVNTLPLRTKLSGDPTFLQFLHRVREATLDAHAHQELPFQKLVEAVQPRRDLSRNPVFQVMFTVQNVPDNALALPGLKVTRFRAGEAVTSKFDLSVFVSDSPEGLQTCFEFNTDLFDADTIARMQQHFANLLEAVAADPDSTIGRLPLLSNSEQRQLREFSETAAAFDPSVCLHQFFEEQARTTPDAVAAVYDKQELSYQELDRRANQVAWYLRHRGVKPGVPVGICLARSLNMLVAVLGILKSGGAYVPLDPSYPDLRLACILEDSAPAFVVTEEKLLPKLRSLDTPLTCLDRDWSLISQQPHNKPLPTSSSEEIAYILFTSGSTGRPKGVAVTHRNASNFVQWARNVFSSDELRATLFATSIGFDLSIFEMFVPWSVGCKVIVADNVLALPELATAHEITLINTVPSAISELLHSGRIPSSVKTINLAGEALPASLVKDLYALGHVRKVYNLYGPTEATTYSTFAKIKPGEAISIGRPIANTQVYVLDRFLQPVPTGVCGEIYIGGEGVARGYWNRPELTAERFIANPIAPQISATLYKTGDLGRYLPDGTLQYIGRSDNQVKVRGFRVELGEIEKVLEAHDAVQQAAVVLHDVAGEPRLAAYIVAKSDRYATEEALRTHLQQQLPAYMVPSFFTFLDHFPLTASGKIDRLVLPEPGRTEPRSTAPRDALESTLLPIWEQVLGVTGLGVTDNFFDHGGHSLLALRLLTEIEKQTGKRIPLSALFQNATVERLANVVRDERKPAHDMVAAVQPEGEYPAFFGVVVPGANPLGFVALARHLGKNQPLYEIQGPGPRLRRPYTPKEYEELAAEYIRSMKTVQPHGPYHFGGMCEGARIAFDMARLLDAEGERVGLLGIFDTWVLENSQNHFLWKIGYYRTRARWFWKISPARKWRALRDWFHRRVGSTRPELLWPRAYWPGKDFVPAKYSGKITVFKVPKQPFFYVNDPLMGWGKRTTGRVDVQLIASKHLALLREPYVRSLAEKLSKCLERARTESPRRLTSPTVVSAPSSASDHVGAGRG